MKILFACDNSQTLLHEFLILGHDCTSCDLLPCSGDYPHLHRQCDVLTILNEGWDMLIGFPPCTYLCKAQQWKCNDNPSRAAQRDEALDFFIKLYLSPVKRIAIENPIGYVNTTYKKPNQIIQPHQFGDAYRKEICFWTWGLPLLLPTYQYTGKLKHVRNHTNSRMSQDQKSFIHSSWKYYPNMCKAIAQQWNF